jgi:hypothetical protein
MVEEARSSRRKLATGQFFHSTLRIVQYQREVRTRELTQTDHLPGLADSRLKVQWRWKLQRVCCTEGLCSELPSCDMKCTPAVEEEDNDVMYSIDGIH